MSYFYVNADWSAIVPAGSAAARFGIQGKDARRLGLDKLPVLDGADAPTGPDAPVPPKVISSANLPEPEVKEAPTPANKAAPKPATKGAARKEPVDGDRN